MASTAPEEAGTQVRIAVFGPGADQLVRSTHLDAISEPHAQGRTIKLVAIPSEVSWGKTSTALVNAVYQDHVLAIVALDRSSSHLAEQIGTKAFVPVIAISSDRMLTSTNIPWIFRLPTNSSLSQALETLIAAIETAGPNREKIRDLLASGSSLAGLRFTPTGEPQ